MIRRLAALSMLVAACGGSPPLAPPTNAPAIPSPASPENAKPKPAGPRLSVRIASNEKIEQRVDVKLEFDALPPFSKLVFAPIHSAVIEAVEAHDDRGTLAFNATTLEAARPTAGHVALTYAVVFNADDKTTDGFQPHAEPIDLRVLGRDVLALPFELDSRITIALQLRTGALQTGGASSFGLGVDQTTTAHPTELREAYFLAGAVETAQFHVSDGDDIAGWLGFTAFDPRWVSASMAGARSAIDAWMGRHASQDAPHALMFQSSTERRDAKIVVHAASRGAVLSVDPRAPWTPVARILVAQAFVQHYVGGFLWVGDRREPKSGAFFASGFSRAIATEVLANVGLLDRAEYASELNTLLFETTFPTEPQRVELARSALVALSLDTTLRQQGKESLQLFVRELLMEAIQTKQNTIPRAAFFAKLREKAGAEKGAKLESALEKGEVDLPADLLAPCYRLTRRELVPFELGFVASADQEMKILSVKPGSKAAAAGLKVGDIIEDLHYEDGKSTVPVDLTLVRNNKKSKVHFVPAGASRPGRVFDRVPGVPDRSC